MERIYCAEQIQVPSDLPTLLKAYTKEVIRYQPDDLALFSRDYFTALHQGEIARFLEENDRKKAAREARENEPSASGIVYQAVFENLPVNKNEAEKKQRLEIWRALDRNHNGYLSLAELEAGFNEVFDLRMVSDIKTALKLAFDAAKKVKSHEGESEKKKAMGDSFVEFSEFRLLLVFLKVFVAMLVIFDMLDKDGDRVITQSELAKAAPSLAHVGIIVTDPDALFRQIDQDNSGSIPFEEFCDWAVLQIA